MCYSASSFLKTRFSPFCPLSTDNWPLTRRLDMSQCPFFLAPTRNIAPISFSMASASLTVPFASEVFPSNCTIVTSLLERISLNTAIRLLRASMRIPAGKLFENALTVRFLKLVLLGTSAVGLLSDVTPFLLCDFLMFQALEPLILQPFAKVYWATSLSLYWAISHPLYWAT